MNPILLNDSTDLMTPLVIGITGHRDIHKGDKEKLKESIRKIFQYLKEKYPITPFILLSPLADGADRIVAEVALNEFKDKITVSVPQPLNMGLYINSFGKGDVESTPEESIREYLGLIKKIFKQEDKLIPKIIPMSFDSTKYEKEKSEQKRTSIRHEQYSLVGEYVALHSHILIALEDPNSEEKDGGTKEIVNKKLSGNYQYVSTIKGQVTLPERGLVYRVITPRIKNELKPENKYEIYKLFPDKDPIPFGTNDEERIKLFDFIKNLPQYIFSKPCLTEDKINVMNSFRQEHTRIECLNQLIHKESENIQIEALGNLKKYTKQKILSKYSFSTENSNLIKHIKMRRAFAYLSSKYQKIMGNWENFLLLLIVISTTIFFMIPSSLKIYKFALYIPIIFIFYISVIYFKKYKKLYEDTRALSEGERVQIAWKLAGINDSVAFSYPSTYKDEFNWIRVSLRALNIFHTPQNSITYNCEKMKKIYCFWINEQIVYFNKNIKKHEKTEYLYKISSDFLILVTSVCTFLLSIKAIFNFDTDSNAYIINQFFLVSLPFIVLSYVKSKQAFDGYTKIIKEYKLSREHFLRASELLKDADKDTTKTKIYESLGIEALRENTFWTILRREKNYKSPSF